MLAIIRAAYRQIIISCIIVMHPVIHVRSSVIILLRRWTHAMRRDHRE